MKKTFAPHFCSLIALLLVLFVSITVTAQVSTLSQKQILAKRYWFITGGKETADVMADTILTSQEVQIQKQINLLIDNDKTLSDSERIEARQLAVKSFQTYAERIRSFYRSEVNVDKILEEIALPLYEKSFSEDELREVVAFYESSAGKKVIQTTPQVILEWMDGLSANVSLKLQEFSNKTASEEFEKIRRLVLKKRFEPQKKGRVIRFCK